MIFKTFGSNARNIGVINPIHAHGINRHISNITSTKLGFGIILYPPFPDMPDMDARIGKNTRSVMKRILVSITAPQHILKKLSTIGVAVATHPSISHILYYFSGITPRINSPTISGNERVYRAIADELGHIQPIAQLIRAAIIITY